MKGRPWIEGNEHPFRQLYMRYRAMTPWKDEPLFPDKSNRKQKAVVTIVKILPQNLMCSIVGWIYNVLRPNHIKRAWYDSFELLQVAINVKDENSLIVTSSDWKKFYSFCKNRHYLVLVFLLWRRLAHVQRT